MRHSSFVLLAACGLATSLAQAQTSPPTITFEGEVTDQTCTATINGQTDAVVALPLVKTSDFQSAGATAGTTPFTVNISGCANVAEGKTQPVSIKFTGPNVTPQGYLANTASNGAADVAVQLLDGTQPIDLLTPTTVKVGDLSGPTPSASKEFTAQYVSEAASVGAGKVTAVVEYTLSYL